MVGWFCDFWGFCSLDVLVVDDCCVRLGLRFVVGSLVNSVGGLVSGCICYLFDFVLGLLLCC